MNEIFLYWIITKLDVYYLFNMAYLLNYLLISWNRALLEKSNGSQLVKKFYGARRFITAFASARHLSLSWARSIHSMPPIPLSEYPFKYFTPIYPWVFQVVSFPQVSLSKPFTLLYSPPKSYMPRPYHSSRFDQPVRSDHYTPHYVVFSIHCYFVPLRPKYSPQHPILRHPQPTFLPRCERDQVSHPQKTTDNIIFLYVLNL